MTEHITVRFDWDKINGNTVTEILGLNATTTNDRSARWESVAICTVQTALAISVEPDTDRIVLSHEFSSYGDGRKRIASFELPKNKSVGWRWISIGSQGYEDSLTIAFGAVVPGAIVPRCAFVVVASSLSCFDLRPRRA